MPPDSAPHAHPERRKFADRRDGSPTLREWINGLSALGKILVTVGGVVTAAAGAIGAASVVGGPSPVTAAAGADAPLAARVDRIEQRAAVTGTMVTGLVRAQCLRSTEQEAYYLELPCDSLMRGIGGWYKSLSAINSLTLILDAGNYVAGSVFSLYGIL